MSIWRCIVSCSIAAMLLLSSAQARLIFTNETLQLGGDKIALDADSLYGGSTELIFDNVNGKSIRWDIADSRFFIQGDTTIGGSLRLEGNTLTLDSDNTAGAPQNVQIVAEQGTQPDGILRYNAVNKEWEIKNGSNSFSPISTGLSTFTNSDLAVLQVRRNTDLTMSVNTWTSIDFNNIDLQNKATVIARHPTITNTVSIYKDGLYMIQYNVNNNDTGVQHRVQTRLLKNGSVVIPGSFVSTSNYQNEFTPNTTTTLVELTAGDTIQLQAYRTTNATIVNETLLSFVKLEQSVANAPEASSTVPIIQLRDGAGGTNMNNSTATPVPWNTQEIVDSGFTHSTSTNTSRITLDTAGRYKVYYSVLGKNSNNSDKNVQCFARRNGSITIPGSQSAGIVRASNYEQSFSGSFYISTLANNDYLEIACYRLNGNNAAVNTVSNQSWVYVEKY